MNISSCDPIDRKLERFNDENVIFDNYSRYDEAEYDSDILPSNETLISLDEYINKVLPLYLEKIFEEHRVLGLGNKNSKNSIHDKGKDKEESRPFVNSDKTQNDEILGKYNKLMEILNEPSYQFKADNQYLYGNNMLHSSVEGSTFSTWSFVEGMVIGQFSVILVIILVLKFFIFSEGSESSPKHTSSLSRSNSGASSFFGSSKLYKKNLFLPNQLISSIVKRGGKDVNHINEETLHISSNLNTILEKTYYDVDSHRPESLDWFNVLIAQIIQQFREEALLKDNIVHSLNDYFTNNSSKMPDYLDDIEIVELDIGDDFPIFSNCRIQYSPNFNKRKLEAKIDIDLSDRLALGVKTKLLLNYPKACTAVLPVDLTVSIVRFQACLKVSLTNAEDLIPTANDMSSKTSDTGYYLMFSFSPEYKLEFDIKSLIGSRSKLENIPKIGSLIEHHIKKWFVERCVEPRFQCIKLPSIWPRSKNTREEKPGTDDDISVFSDR